MEKSHPNHQQIEKALATLFAYLRNIIYEPNKASLSFEELPEMFIDFGRALVFLHQCTYEMTTLAKELARGNINCDLPSRKNEMAAPLKMLHASLSHLSWQAQQVADGDYQQRVDFMGDFSIAFNNMIKELEKREQDNINEKSALQRYMKMLLASAPDPILLYNREHKLVYVSDAYLAMCNIDNADSLIGIHVCDLVTPLASSEVLQKLEALIIKSNLEQRSIVQDYVVYLPMFEEQKFFQLQIFPIMNEEKETEGTMVILHDVTEEEKSRKEVEKARQIAERSSRAKTDFLGRMSHEMRTPMNAIIGMTSLYKIVAEQEKKDYCVEKVSEASKYLLGLINDILDMSNLETDNLHLSFSEINVRKLFGDVVNNFAFKISAQKHDFSYKIAANVPDNIHADGKRLKQVIDNLVANAIKFTPKNGRVSLKVKVITKNKEDYLQIKVSDNGIGIAPEVQDLLFKPFEQIDGGVSRRYGGVGLGLVISKRIVEMMNGTISFDSVPEKGTTFIVEILIAEGKRKNRRISKGEESTQLNTGNIFAGYRLLLAEDIEINREVIVALLEPTGIEIDWAKDGLEAFEKFVVAPESYHLILMDINMPNMNGYEAASAIRNLEMNYAKQIPIIAVTANAYAEDIERCFAVGMNDHISKPIDLNNLLGIIKKNLH